MADMTLVTIDITGVASSTGPADHVIFSAPVIREDADGGIISTREEKVMLVEGIGDIDLAPGPVVVKLMCEGIYDRKEKRGVVPNTGPVTLADVLARSFTYEPEVVSAAIRARDEAVASVGDAVNRFSHEVAPLVDQASQAALDARDSAAIVGSAERVLEAEQNAIDAEAQARVWAWQAHMATGGITVAEDPPGSGLWSFDADPLVLTETAPGSGLYEIGVI